MILFARELASKVSDRKIFVNSLHPGSFIGTGISLSSGDANLEMVKDVVKNYIPLWLYTLIRPYISMTPYNGALTSLYVATSPVILKDDIRGQFFDPIAKLSEIQGSVNDMKRQKDLWKLSELLLEERGFRIPPV